LLTACGKQ
jgi:hypothetical protein